MLSRNEKYKHPKWQHKRLEILSRDNFECRCCESKNRTLHVHHIWYPGKGKEIWETDNINLITLCDECHKEWHRIYNNADSDLVAIVVDLFNKVENEAIRIEMEKETTIQSK